MNLLDNLFPEISAQSIDHLSDPRDVIILGADKTELIERELEYDTFL